MNEQEARLRRLAEKANRNYLLLTAESLAAASPPPPAPSKPLPTAAALLPPEPLEERYHSRGWGLDE